MRKLLTLIPALALAASLFAADPPKSAAAKGTAKESTAAAPVTPRKAGEFVIHLPDGTDKLLSSYRGKTVVMAFMFTACPHCQHTAGILAKFQTEYAAKGVQILGVTFDANAARDVANFDKLYATDFPCGYSSEDTVLKFLHAQPGYFVPILVFIDRTGTVRFQNIVMSAGDAAEKFLDNDHQEANIRGEIDKYLKIPATAAPKQTPTP